MPVCFLRSPYPLKSACGKCFEMQFTCMFNVCNIRGSMEGKGPGSSSSSPRPQCDPNHPAPVSQPARNPKRSRKSRSRSRRRQRRPSKLPGSEDRPPPEDTSQEAAPAELRPAVAKVDPRHLSDPALRAGISELCQGFGALPVGRQAGSRAATPKPSSPIPAGLINMAGATSKPKPKPPPPWKGLPLPPPPVRPWRG